MNWELLSNAQATLGEGPVWLPESKQVIWVDIEGQCVYLHASETGETKQLHVGQRIGAIVPMENGRFLCALQHGFYELDPADGSLTAIVDPEDHLPGNRFNDGKCDPAGRFWAGTMPMQGGGTTGALYRMDQDGSVHQMETGISCSNGLAWSADGSVMYYIDTGTRRVDRYDCDPATGAITNRRPVIHIPAELGHPDGMSIDAEGMLWVALWGGCGVRRFNPETGECLSFVELPVSLVTSCCFSGDQLDELIITSARVGFTAEKLEREPLAGSTFRVKVGVQGTVVDRYRQRW